MKIIDEQLNKQNRRFIFTMLNKELKFDRYENSFLWLKEAAIAIPVYIVDELQSPLIMSKASNVFKLFMSDVGLLTSNYPNFVSRDLLNGNIENELNNGALFENYVAQELICSDITPYYFKNQKIKDKCLFIISVKSFISKITCVDKLDVSEINATVGKMLEESIQDDELINLGQLTRGNSLQLLSDTMLSKLRAMKDKNVAAEVLSRAIKTTISDIGKINLTLQEKFSTKFNKLVDIEIIKKNCANVVNEITPDVSTLRSLTDLISKYCDNIKIFINTILCNILNS